MKITGMAQVSHTHHIFVVVFHRQVESHCCDSICYLLTEVKQITDNAVLHFIVQQPMDAAKPGYGATPLHLGVIKSLPKKCWQLAEDKL